MKKKKKKKKFVIPPYIIPFQPSEKTKDELDLHSLVIGIPVKISMREDLVIYINSSVNLDITRHADQIESSDSLKVAIVRDPLNTYGSQFYFVLDDNAVTDLILQHNLNGDGKAESDADEIAQELSEINLDDPAVTWDSHGSEIEVDDMKAVTGSRPLMTILCKTNANLAGRICRFSDSTIDQEQFVEILPKQYDAEQWEYSRSLDIAIQNVTVTSNTSMQTNRVKYSNQAAQYQGVTLSEEAVKKHLRQKKLQNFLRKTVPKIEEMLDENLIYDPFADDWNILGQFGN